MTDGTATHVALFRSQCRQLASPHWVSLLQADPHPCAHLPAMHNRQLPLHWASTVHAQPHGAAGSGAGGLARHVWVVLLHEPQLRSAQSESLVQCCPHPDPHAPLIQKAHVPAPLSQSVLTLHRAPQRTLRAEIGDAVGVVVVRRGSGL